jgi:cytidyltransferase-like protein
MRVVASGYFDPIHSGHINYLKAAKNLAGRKGELIVILNNEKQAVLKKDGSFMSVNERKAILESIKYVDKVVISEDKDRSVKMTLKKIHPNIFAVGMDNYKNKLLEKEVTDELGIKVVDRLAKKLIIHPSMKQSSSKIIKNYLKRHKCKCKEKE